MRKWTLSALILLLVPVAAAAQTLYDTSPGAQTGVQVYGSYFSGDIDSVSLYNRNLSLSIPLFTLPGRELPVGVGLSYNSQKWQEDWCGNYTCGLYTGGARVATPFNDSLSLWVAWESCQYVGGSYTHKYTVNGYWVDGLGTKRRYILKGVPGFSGTPYCIDVYAPPSPNDRTLTSVDSDGSTLWTGAHSYGTDPASITFREGTIRYFRTAANSSSLTRDIVTLNDNYLVEGSNKLPTQDTLGRTIQFECVSPCSTDSYQHKYKITDSNGDLQAYTIQFQQLTVYDPIASAYYSEQYTRTLNGVVSWVELPNGKRYTFEYGTDGTEGGCGLLRKVTLPSGAYIRYSYAHYCNQLSTGDQILYRRVSSDGASGSEKTWYYSGAEVFSPEGERVEHSFTSEGMASVTKWKKADGTVLKTVTASWSNSGVESNGQANNPKVSTTTTILPEGAISKKEVTYDSNNYVTQEKVWDWGTNNLNMSLVFQKDIAYTTITGAVKKVATETATAINPANGQFEVQGKTEYSYDDFSLTNRGTGVPNHTHSTTASGRGNLTKVRKYKDASNFLETQMKYDNVGNLIETLDPLSHSTTIDFTDNFTDTSKNGSLFAFPKKVTNALGQFATSKYDFNTGLVKEITNLRGNTTTTAYDLMNRITSITEPNNKMTTYAYDDTNRITTKQVTVDDVTPTPNKGTVKTYFDKLYRVVQTRTNDPDPAGEIAVDTEYDGNGRVKKTSNPYRVSGGTPVWTQTAYDALSRPLVITAPDSSTVQYAYANNQTTTTDQAGNQRRYTYNVLGQLTKVEEPKPSLYTPAVTTYAYYGFGPLYRSTQSSQTRTWVYNWIGQMTSQTLPESGATSFTYDGAGRLSTKTDARSVVTTMAYDNANRVTQRSYSDSTPAVSFGYDDWGNTGLRTSMVDGLGTVWYDYDSMDRLTLELRALTGVNNTFETSYVYNVKGDVTQMTYPSGRVVNFGYATGGGCCNSRLSSVADGTTGTTLLNGIAFNAAGGVTSQTLNPGSNAISETFTYNNRLQLTQIQAVKGSTTVIDFSYDYGTSSTNTGRVLKRTDALQPEHSANYVYDSLYRLAQAVGADNSWSISWALDTWGNRTSQTPAGLATSKVGSPTIGYSSNKNTSHTYDSAGNTTNDTVHTYAFNAENQQTSMDGGAATYGYDGEGRRMKKTATISGVTETTYSFYGPGGILCEYTTTNTGATAASSTDKTIYRTSEKTGTAVLLFNTSGTVIENNRTLPYGEAWLSDVASANDKKFTTYDRDKESGLDYAMNRMYASAQGQMTTPDKGPVILYRPSTLNRYAYVGLDPINQTDPTGNFESIEGPKPPKPPPPSQPSQPLCPVLALCGPASVEETVQEPSPSEKIEAIGQRNAMRMIKAGIGLTGFVGNQSGKLFEALESVLTALQKPDCAALIGTTASLAATFLSQLRFVSSQSSGIKLDFLGFPSKVEYAHVFDTPTGVAGRPADHPITLNLPFFNQSPGSISTMILHEIWHFRGGGDQVDSDRAKGAPTIISNCGTGRLPSSPGGGA